MESGHAECEKPGCYDCIELCVRMRTIDIVSESFTAGSLIMEFPEE